MVVENLQKETVKIVNENGNIWIRPTRISPDETKFEVLA